ncbi:MULTISPECIES: 2-succinyl-5-enolpyruvyl-6-hydroxy-3-cyclohexene-1-carboxylic-acid synthase [Pseudonocardia]|uniref:2-succinyl-5-enolpyruvyl-6-hydroxy-3-cyclohexene-1-carboxylate synthase n=2 Tax=Pseudonocardia TaxID=1847 RepID=A0A1Y2N0N3_PSEAH|nr:MULTISPECIES: 2-succinyl-5-enolpyruvyl-6-hydroxy-3-cyclohexene-1-carboxylic-acid synthase [Pseudonocardia]OSY40841.1 2-succinyl-5-enolpyruvyl-6-hydroxy-3-cyclohexene-1-carboxylate synthase [Pseudonocardia autotrophica]TDN71851.1 2-succinyl-5-enolpyruvyl-6-hydroxy-3-cyclohexene-1-carboxylate synthase [Pseudonocardia autotrophica]BBG02539.1 2-succinyl-5-enolpyruvyl-6-hydroxy-3-cyclohexene- 1-carboxylate synthase [Pseudonocardia autotrophica]GEC29302.1 2-succinyl-5-enolpyruvyl-6-hydroxy-3-cyclo
MNPSTALATVLTDELARCGLTDAVVCPGARNTALLLALERHPAIRVHVRIDERSAGFCALGLGRCTGRPAAVVCTSGTAAANLHPAVVEAHESGTPLLVLTADRPAEMRDIGSNQVIDQTRLYGTAVRWFCEIAPDTAPAAPGPYWRSTICQAWRRTTGTDPGPVHLDVPFRDPLVPGTLAELPAGLDGRPDGAPWTRTADRGEVPAEPAPQVERGVIICGDGCRNPAAMVALAEATGWPLLAEPTSGARNAGIALRAPRALLGDPGFARAHPAELVVTSGRPGLSRGTLAYLRTARSHIVVEPGPRVPDPVRTASLVVPALAPPERPVPAGWWTRRWRTADAAVSAALDRELDRRPGLDEPRVARDLVRALPERALLLAGPSMPIRDLDLVAPGRPGIRMIANRGASGIDGVVSTAVGAALAHGGPAYALIGDLTLLHDRNGLLPGPGEAAPDLTIVVLANDGGGIFSELEHGDLGRVPGWSTTVERLFGTPHGVQVGTVAAAAGARHRLVRGPGELTDAIRAGAGGLRIVEVRTDRAEQSALRRELREVIATRLAGCTGSDAERDPALGARGAGA